MVEIVRFLLLLQLNFAKSAIMTQNIFLLISNWLMTTKKWPLKISRQKLCDFLYLWCFTFFQLFFRQYLSFSVWLKLQKKLYGKNWKMPSFQLWWKFRSSVQYTPYCLTNAEGGITYPHNKWDTAPTTPSPANMGRNNNLSPFSNSNLFSVIALYLEVLLQLRAVRGGLD